jgi:sulfhydrogenase subunit beta (sulfur reductase)
MPLRMLANEHLTEFLTALSDHRQLIGPVQEGSTHNFRPVSDPSELDFSYTMTVLPPSKWIYRNQEPLLDFQVGDPSSARMPAVAEPIALVGVHPCDIHAIRVMDETLSDTPADTAYMERRRRTIIVGYQCQTPCGEHAFCFDKGTHVAQIGFDIMMSQLENGCILESGSDQGDELMGEMEFLRNPTFQERQALAHTRENTVRQHKNRINGDLAKLAPALRDSIDGLLWEVVGRKCFSCGSCNIVCPTCYCFEVVDEVDCLLQEGRRIRIWDACQARNFAVVASGENFRPYSPERNMHRIFKKEVYVYDKYEMSACVGCGRCNRACIANINLIEIYNQVLGG